MTRYASQTQVSPDRSRGEIERVLQRYGATQFVYGWEESSAVIGFRADNRNIRFVVPLPDRNADEFTLTPGRKYERHPDDAHKAWEQAVKQRWRALALAIKAKLETVESGIATFEDEFLSYIVLPGGETMGQWSRPQIEQAYASGKMPSMLPALPSGKAS